MPLKSEADVNGKVHANCNNEDRTAPVAVRRSPNQCWKDARRHQIRGQSEVDLLN